MAEKFINKLPIKTSLKGTLNHSQSETTFPNEKEMKVDLCTLMIPFFSNWKKSEKKPETDDVQRKTPSHKAWLTS